MVSATFQLRLIRLIQLNLGVSLHSGRAGSLTQEHLLKKGTILLPGPLNIPNLT